MASFNSSATDTGTRASSSPHEGAPGNRSAARTPSSTPSARGASRRTIASTDARGRDVWASEPPVPWPITPYRLPSSGTEGARAGRDVAVGEVGRGRRKRDSRSGTNSRHSSADRPSSCRSSTIGTVRRSRRSSGDRIDDAKRRTVGPRRGPGPSPHPATRTRPRPRRNPPQVGGVLRARELPTKRFRDAPTSTGTAQLAERSDRAEQVEVVLEVLPEADAGVGAQAVAADPGRDRRLKRSARNARTSATRRRTAGPPASSSGSPACASDHRGTPRGDARTSPDRRRR